MPRSMMRWLLALSFAAMMSIGTPTQSQAGVIPWAWDALFGPPGSQQLWWAGYPNGNPYTGGYGIGSRARGSSSFYGPSSFGQNYGYGAGAGNCCGSNYGPSYNSLSYGYGNACCSPCGTSPCGTSPCGSSPCGTSGCASGDCNTNSNYSPEPTPDPASDGTPPTYRKDPPPDDFKPTTPRENNGIGSGTPNSTIPNTNSTIPNSTIPNSTIPNANPNSTIPGSGTFERPAPGEPGGGLTPIGPVNDPNRVMKPKTGDIKPIDIKSTVVGTVSPVRRRITSRAGFRIPSVARLHVKPSTITTPAEPKIAAK